MYSVVYLLCLNASLEKANLFISFMQMKDQWPDLDCRLSKCQKYFDAVWIFSDVGCNFSCR